MTTTKQITLAMDTTTHCRASTLLVQTLRAQTRVRRTQCVGDGAPARNDLEGRNDVKIRVDRDVLTDAVTVSYTHLDVYKRQAGAQQASCP